MSSLKFINNQKGGQSVIRGGYRYNCQKNNNNNTSLWRCVQCSTCSATLTLDITKTIVLRENLHSCESNIIKNEISEALAKCKQRVTENLEPIQKKFEEVFEPLRRKGINYIRAIPAFESVKMTLYRIRRKFLHTDKLYFRELIVLLEKEPKGNTKKQKTSQERVKHAHK
ncbi:FLYWCH zinc finger domain-containing protein [Phthorimaea operculella]|nr:FLYWCH zinc finger domain-containing protein [Phthorimaea operculella]